MLSCQIYLIDQITEIYNVLYDIRSRLPLLTLTSSDRGDEEVVNWPDPLYVPGLFDIFNSVELHGTHFRGFVLLAVRTAKHYHLAAHVGYELSGEMPETANVRRRQRSSLCGTLKR